jgi:methylenetetrahydrofolate--tRNA-(uracil-5-)-methyltransferase
MTTLTIIGGGLAGSEAAYQAAQRGITVQLYEMRPKRETGAHVTPYLAELVCSNSLGSDLPDRAGGVLKEELRLGGSLLLRCAEATRVPAGGCLAVDRDEFARKVTEELKAHPLLSIIREEVCSIPSTPTIVASGPLTSPQLSESLAALHGQDHLFFFDAIAPILEKDSVDFSKAFIGSRWERGELEEGDYINCPLTRDEYYAFVTELKNAQRITLESFEQVIEQGVRAGLHRFFEGCMPVEIMAARGDDTLAFGPMRPVGLRDPRTGKTPFAVVQLRQDNLAATCYNMVGFQTNLTFPEQRRVFSTIPGLENAEFVRFGQMHRNTFINAPHLLLPSLQAKQRPDLFFAGQITGVEGYAGNIATGLLAGINAARVIRGQQPLLLPQESMLGSLCHYVAHADDKDFQPMKANFGILPPLAETPKRQGKRERGQRYGERALSSLKAYLLGMNELCGKDTLSGQAIDTQICNVLNP